MIEQELTLTTPDGPMRTFVVHPDGDGPFPVAVLYMDAPGYREQLKENARRFAADGYWCVAPDLWHHFGDDVSFDMNAIREAGFKGPEIDRMLSFVGRLSPALVKADTEAILIAAKSDPTADDGAKVCVGYCMGARYALHAAATLPEQFVAAAGIHPGTLLTDGPDSPHHDLDTVAGELYFAFAENDEYAPEAMVDALREEMTSRGVPGTVERMPGTYHGFAMADVPSYQPQAAAAHFERTLALWRRNIEQQPVARA